MSKDDNEERDEVVVEQLRGDSLNVRPPDLLKVDVEGAEAGVIRGLTSVLESIDTIVIEIHPTMLPRFGDEPEDVTDVIESHGFSELYEEKRNEQTHIVYQQ